MVEHLPTMSEALASIPSAQGGWERDRQRNMETSRRALRGELVSFLTFHCILFLFYQNYFKISMRF